MDDAPGGVFFSEFYSAASTVRGRSIGDGLVTDVEGPLRNVGQTCLYSRGDIDALFADWAIVELHHTERNLLLPEPAEKRATWELVTRKPAPATGEPR